MAQVEVTVIPLLIEAPLWIEPFHCPCCGEAVTIDRMKLVDQGAPPHMPPDAKYYRVQAVKAR